MQIHLTAELWDVICRPVMIGSGRRKDQDLVGSCIRTGLQVCFISVWHERQLRSGRGTNRKACVFMGVFMHASMGLKHPCLSQQNRVQCAPSDHR